MKYKICTGCKEQKDICDFYKRPTGYSAKCKYCTCLGYKEKRLKERIPSENELLLLENKRRCSCCLEIKSTDLFHKKRKSYEGFCKICKDNKKKTYVKEHPEVLEKIARRQKIRKESDPSYVEKLRKYSAEYFQRNKERHGKWVNDWKKNNPDKNRRYRKKWEETNKAAIRGYSNKRRAAKIRAIPKWLDSEWEDFVEKELYELCILREEMLGIVWQLDHIVPLQSEFVCGLHYSANFQLLTKLENISKSNKYWPDMWE